ncbi:MAG TPA: 3-dehydro-L-gulonate 2-dehydrogenase [Acidobacteriaceae bacterium]|jgi:3-dehydro-L-gulonate 2-dehydrogenase|nr:3-dehydro-L-gulonate 2-dehydrogenase [Acidobacteriaceae bacterium]
MLRIPFDELASTLAGILTRLGFESERAVLCARLFAETTCDGVYSHGVERFPRFLAMIRNGSVDIHATPVLVHAAGALERWDGRGGVGNLNAFASMDRALALARQHGMGCVALANTNHWMRGGTYGWQAAEAGSIALCWTNTLANLPPWGAAKPAVGNNPLILSVPRPDGPVILDMAMSQFSYGALTRYQQKGELLPVDGGFDAQGNLTRDPAAIEASQRPLPIGYWKGSGLAMLLDMMAALLSGGLATHQIPTDPLRETGLSQIFLAIDLAAVSSPEESARASDAIVASVVEAGASVHGSVRYPGQQILNTRADNRAHGIPVRAELWDELRRL